MKIAVIGAGAIGGLVAGYLKLKQVDVSLVGRPESVRAILEKGLKISGVRGNFSCQIKISEKLDYAPRLAIICTKTQDIDTVFTDNREFLGKALILTTQNGIQSDNLAAKYTHPENIISSIVMFGATALEPGKVVHNFEGSWILGKIFGKAGASVIEISRILQQIFPVQVSEDLLGMKYLKIFVNANNCIPAILGKSMQEVFSDPEISKISICIWKEGLEVISKTGIDLVSLPDFPLERLMKLASMPVQEAAKIFSGIMSNLSKEPLYGSILQSIKRGKASEIDYINGEFVNIARANNLQARLNEKLVELVHGVEKTRRFLTKEELLRQAFRPS